MHGVSYLHFTISEMSVTGKVPPGIRTVMRQPGILTTMMPHFEK